MIYTLTLNPCIDKTVKTEDFEIGATNRAISYTKSICGKGINTAVVIKNLGKEVSALGFEYEQGASVSAYLESKGIPTAFVSVPGELRTNIKIYDSKSGVTTELNEKGGLVTEDKLSEIVNKISQAVKEGDVFVISGSVPQGVPTDIYGELISSLKARNVYTVLDAEGELLKYGIKEKPYMIKPNRDELSSLLGKTVKSLNDAISAAKELCEFGIKNVCVSLGSDGAVFVSDKVVFHTYNELDGLEIKGTVGAGDSMVAGLAIGINEKMQYDAMLKMASALSAGSVSLPSTELCTSELYGKMLTRVVVKEL